MSTAWMVAVVCRRRTPQGVRGLKYLMHTFWTTSAAQSHPARGAWIEIYESKYLGEGSLGRTPQGVRGLK